jgi:hypothetical protein
MLESRLHHAQFPFLRCRCTTWEVSDGGTEPDKISKCFLRCTHFEPRRLLSPSAICTLPSLPHFTPYHASRGLSDSQFSRFVHLLPPQSRTMSSRRACRSIFTEGGWITCARVFARSSPGQSSPLLHVPCCLCTHSHLLYCRPCSCCFPYHCTLLWRNFWQESSVSGQRCTGSLF